MSTSPITSPYFIVVSRQVLRKAKNNFLTGLPKAVAVEVRRTMTECIMATDMAVHFGLITQTKAVAADAGKSAFTRPQAKLFLCKMLGTWRGLALMSLPGHW